MRGDHETHGSLRPTFELSFQILLPKKNNDSKAYLTINKLLSVDNNYFNPLNAELNPICYLLALLGAHHFIHVSRIRVKSLTLRLLISYIYIYI